MGDARFQERIDRIIEGNREALELLADDEPQDPAWQYAFELEAKLAEKVTELESERTARREAEAARRRAEEELRGKLAHDGQAETQRSQWRRESEQFASRLGRAEVRAAQLIAAVEEHERETMDARPVIAPVYMLANENLWSSVRSISQGET